MNTTSTYFLQTDTTGNLPDPNITVTFWPPSTTAPELANPVPRDQGVCPSCGRCRECGHKADPWERYWQRPWWAREWVPPYQITWTYDPNDAPWAVY